MNKKTLKLLLEPQFGKLGKSSGEQLWAHHYTTWNIAHDLLSFLDGVPDKIKKNIEIASLIHDIGKMSDEHQLFYKGESKKKPIHRASKEKISEYLQPLIESGILDCDDEDINQSYEIAYIHHSVSEADIQNAVTSRFGVYAEILRRADWLASAESVDSTTINEIREKYKPFFDLTYFRIARFASPTTSLLQKNAVECYNKRGWQVLSQYSNGIIFIGPKNSEIPVKSEILNDFYQLFLGEMLSLQSPNIYGTRGNFFVGLAPKYPHSFLETHKQRFIEALSDIEVRHLYFLKIVAEILSLEKNFQNMDTDLPYLSIVNRARSNAHVNKAIKLYNEISGEHIENIKDVFKNIFNNVSIDKFLPGNIYKDFSVKIIKDYTANELFELIDGVARGLEKYDETDEIQKEFISMNFNLEEETDFRKHAIKIFDKYKEYKVKNNPSKGICERCGCYISIPQHERIFFTKGRFSQISSSKRDVPATCQFCAFDNMVLKRAKMDTPITVVVESKTRPIIENKFLEQVINRFYNGLHYPYQFTDLMGLDETTMIPFVNRIRIPCAKKEHYADTDFHLLQENEFGFQMSLPLTKANFKPNVKNRKAQLRPLYHFLNLLGYRVHIGETDQRGLFGEFTISTLEKYYNSMAVIILSNAIKSEQAYLKAERLLERIPSVAIATIGAEDVPLSKELIIYFFQLIYKSNQIIHYNQKEEFRMRTLLEDAAFFAENIPKFCWTSDDWSKWHKNHSKHAATKPIAASMNELLQGRSVEESYAKFLSFIRQNIAKDKTCVDKGKNVPTTDESELKQFLDVLKKKIETYESIRNANISDFIRIKNAMMSAIFTYKRYPSLIEGESHE
ncbi:MAG: hypothetical protein ABIJ12_07015 [bacterium]